MFVPLSAKDFIDRAKTVYGERIGIIDEPLQPAEPLEQLSYARIDELARAQAAALDALGVLPGERVAIVSHNSARLLISFFGVCAYGRVLVPINFRLSRDEVAYIVEKSGTKVPPPRSTSPAAPRRTPKVCRSRIATYGLTPPLLRCTPECPIETCICTLCRCSTPTAGGCRSR